MDSEKKLLVGLDMGSVNAKLVAIAEWDLLEALDKKAAHTFLSSVTKIKNNFLYTFKITKVLGDPSRASFYLLSTLFKHIPQDIEIHLGITGSQANIIAQSFDIPITNEFKAIARGVVTIYPDARTILEIGGDGSRYLKVDYNKETDELSITDYQRNGDCAAGTGSFIDQQAARLKFDIEDIGPLVLEAETSANIAGRCSVFAKSDMVHAQQRGYSPASILKGLCEAVVRNFKGTVLKGKKLEENIVFVGGVASNSGVVQAVKNIFDLHDGQPIVPRLNSYVGAIGAALNSSNNSIFRSELGKLKTGTSGLSAEYATKVLSLKNVIYPQIGNKPTSKGQNSERTNTFLGIDIGSVSTNLVLMDQNGHVLDEIYTRTDGRPVEVVQREMSRWQKKWASRTNIIGVGTTGSGRELVGELVGADAIHDEITAHKTGASFIAKTLFNKDVDTIFEIGGQDSKFISIEKGIVVDFAMNEACAAGTGSFLEEQAAKLGIPVKDEFAKLALKSKSPVQMGERCTVFMEKDVTAYMQRSVSKTDITAGLAFAVVQNYLNRVVRGRKIGDVIFFQGGTAYNKSVAAAFSTTLGKQIYVPPHNGVIGALGAALLAQEKFKQLNYLTRFRGFDLSQVNFKISHISCKACSNQCDVQQVTVDGEKTYWGDKCSEQFRQKKKVSQKATIPDLVETYLKVLHEKVPPPNGLGIKIGFPRTMYHFDRFPFWATYFGELGAEIVLSDTTNKKIIADGKDLCLSEPCFPIVASHGHFQNIISKKVDFTFIPNVINSETDDRGRESWFCPWGQTLPLVLKNTIGEKRPDAPILSPNIRFRDGFNSLNKSLTSVAKKLGVSPKKSKASLELAYDVQNNFRKRIQDIGVTVLSQLEASGENAVVLIGRPYNIYDPGLNLNVPAKLHDDYGINVIPMDYLPIANIPVRDIHNNMFWNYGRRILQAAKYVSQNKNLHVIYFTNFKCGPDSYIKHFVSKALGAAYLTLQFDDHSNDAGIMTRCEAYLESKGLLRSEKKQAVKTEALVL